MNSIEGEFPVGKYAAKVVVRNGIVKDASAYRDVIYQRPALYMESQQLMGNCCNIIQRYINI